MGCGLLDLAAHMRPNLHEPTNPSGRSPAAHRRRPRRRQTRSHDEEAQRNTPGRHASTAQHTTFPTPPRARTRLARSSTRAFPFPACPAPRLIAPERRRAPDPNADPPERSRPIRSQQQPAACPHLTRSRLPRAAPRRPLNSPRPAAPASARRARAVASSPLAINLRPLPARRPLGSRYRR